MNAASTAVFRNVAHHTRDRKKKERQPLLGTLQSDFRRPIGIAAYHGGLVRVVSRRAFPHQRAGVGRSPAFCAAVGRITAADLPMEAISGADLAIKMQRGVSAV